MSQHRATHNRSRHARRVQQEELLVRRRTRGKSERTVAFQWRDGAGELHYETLSPAQSWPYLVKE